jgi:hypothetical protein
MGRWDRSAPQRWREETFPELRNYALTGSRAVSECACPLAFDALVFCWLLFFWPWTASHGETGAFFLKTWLTQCNRCLPDEPLRA